MYDKQTTIRMLLSTAVVAAFAALLAGNASAFVMDVEGGGGNGTAPVAAQPQVEPGTIPYLSHGIGVDQSLFSGAATAEGLDPAIRAAILAKQSSANVAAALTEKGPIPYLSHGIGVDQTLFQGEQSLGLTGDTPITRVVGLEPQGLTGDTPRTRGDVSGASASLATGSDVNWTWVGFGAGMAALLAAVMGALYLSARNRDRVALP
jgi:hypothetical protein